MFERFFISGLGADPLLWKLHDLRLVALSLVVSMAASAVALHLAALARAANSPGTRQMALASGALALGSGIWTMHYVGMLAFALCGQAKFDPWLTLLSIVPGLGASWVALRVLTLAQLTPGALLASGALTGAGIGTMHYTGMAASSLAPLMRYDVGGFLLSLVVAIALALLALWIRFGLRHARLSALGKTLLGGGIMGLAIAGMHYTGMAALRFTQPIAVLQTHQSNTTIQTQLVLAIVIVTVTLSLAVIALNTSLRYRKLLQAAQRSEARLRAISNTAVDAILTLDRQARILSINAAGEQLLGWRASELMGRHIHTLVPEPFRTGHDLALEEYMAGRPSGLDAIQDVDVLCRNGQLLPMRLAMGRVEPDADEDAPIFVSNLADLSQYRALEQERERDQQQLRSLVGNLPGVAFRSRTDGDWPMLFISDGVRDLTGWEPEDFLQGRVNFGQLIPVEDIENFSGIIESAIASAQPYQIEYRIQTRNRSTRWVSEFGRGIADDNGEVRWLDGVILDITDSKLQNAEFIGTVQALQRSQIMAEFDLYGRVINANANFLALTGYSLNEVLGQPHFLFCTPEEAASPSYQQFWDELLLGHYQAGEYHRVGKNNRDVWIQATYNPILDAEGRPFKILKLANDLTQRRTMEQDLREAKEHAEQAAAARASFLANMSHEIRTPMNAILGFTDALLDSPLSVSQRRHLGTIQTAGRTLLRLLNDILDTAKLDKGAVTLETIDFSLRTVCTNTLDTLRINASGKNLALRLDYPDSEPDYFTGDPLRLQQVLMNLLGNAIKFTEHGEVVLHVHYLDGALIIAIQDSGIGMNEQQVERIFAPFAQADASTTRRFGGTGLGTTIAHQLVVLMGGTITVQSTLGQGSTFTLRIPLPLGHAPQSVQEAAEATPLPPLRILAVDDVPANLELLQLALVRSGHRLTTANSGTEALRLLHNNSFDIALMDLQMPDLDGFAVTRHIRRLEQEQQRPPLPIIALSASVLEEDRALALDAGMNGFAHKPLDMLRLTAEIARVLGLKTRATVTTSTTNALQRSLHLWGSAEALQQARSQFFRDHSDLPQRLQSLIEASDLSALATYAHRLYGAAGNLGMEMLHTALGKLEISARNRDLPNLQQAQQVVANLWQPFAAELPDNSTDVTSSAIKLTHETISDALSAIHQLRQALQHGELHDRAWETLEAGLPDALLTALQTALNRFDFSAAQIHLSALDAELRKLDA